MLQVASRFGVGFRRLMRVLFPAGIVLPVFAAFLSISYFGNSCTRYSTSKEVIESSDQLFQVAQQEMSALAETLAYVLLFWALIYAVLLVVWKKSRISAR